MKVTKYFKIAVEGKSKAACSEFFDMLQSFDDSVEVKPLVVFPGAYGISFLEKLNKLGKRKKR